MPTPASIAGNYQPTGQTGNLAATLAGAQKPWPMAGYGQGLEMNAYNPAMAKPALLGSTGNVQTQAGPYGQPQFSYRGRPWENDTTVYGGGGGPTMNNFGMGYGGRPSNVGAGGKPSIGYGGGGGGKPRIGGMGGGINRDVYGQMMGQR